MVGSHRFKSLRGQNRASLSSLSSHDSGGSGKKKQNETLFNECKERHLSCCQFFRVLSFSYQVMAEKKGCKDCSVDLLASEQIIFGNQRSLDQSSNRNEEWDGSNKARSCKIFPPYHIRLKPFIECAAQIPKNKRSVTLGETRVVSCQDTSPPNATDLWYSTSDHEQFTIDALSCARTARRVMEYASKNENTYKSSIGLTSPQVLEEYLSCPQEIVGIEHLLSGQGPARSSLRFYHGKCLFEEQRRQNEGGRRDPDSLAQKLNNNSRISSHMAEERAAYIALLD